MYQQVARQQEAVEVARIKAAFLALEDPNDWTGDGDPEGWDVIDRAFTKAEARYIPNGRNSTADMAHPTRTGDLVVFSSPPYQFDAATPGTLIARSAFFGQHGYVPDVKNLRGNTNMRATFLAGGDAIKRGVVRKVRSIDLAPTAAFLLDVPSPGHSQGVVRRDLIDFGRKYTPVPIVALNDFHGQLDPSTTTVTIDGRTIGTAGASQLATLFDEEARALPKRELLLSGGDNVGGTPPASALLDDRPAIDVENAWDLDATAYGNHEFDYGVPRILQHLARADFPFLSTNIVEESTGREPPWMDTSAVFKRQRRAGRRDRLDGPDHAGARAGRRDRRPRVPRRGGAHPPRVGEAAQARRQGPGGRHPRGRRPGRQPRRGPGRRRRGRGRSSAS